MESFRLLYIIQFQKTLLLKHRDMISDFVSHCVVNSMTLILGSFEIQQHRDNAVDLLTTVCTTVIYVHCTAYARFSLAFLVKTSLHTHCVPMPGLGYRSYDRQIPVRDIVARDSEG